MASLIYKEIEKLKQTILRQGALVEDNVRTSVSALENMNIELAERVIEKDRDIDQKEVDLEEECLKILALFQPVATDLRFIIAVMKINNDLERISDLAVNIAESVRFLVHRTSFQVPFDFSIMVGKVQSMLRKSINALIELDAKQAYDVCAKDDEVDALNRQMYTIVNNMIQQDTAIIEEIMHYLSISRYLERMADHATNIAEDVIYMIDGAIVRHRVEDYTSHHE